MKQEWVKSEFAKCALWSCGRMLDIEWCLDWHKIGGQVYAVCQGGHHGVNDRAELQAQYDRLKRFQEYPYKMTK